MPPILLRLAHLLRSAYYFFTRPVLFGVRVMLVQNGQVLLVRHTYVDGWYFPGGGLKRGETPEAAARREVREEAGAEAGPLELVGIYTSRQWQTDHNVLFLCRDFRIVGQSDSEIAEARCFPLDDLPGEVVAGHRRCIEEFRDGQPSPKFGEW
jgi:8-oxo-dGTP pyrophosphatase MutT (NUDIX family)